MTQLYSLTSRFNYIVYNMMAAMMICGVLNHLTVRYGHLIGLAETPIGLPKESIDFSIKEVDQFLYDRYFKEDAVSFTFDLDVDLTPIINWNTHTIFASVVCEFATETSAHNSVTVWDQRIMRTAPEYHQIKLKNEHVEYYLTDINRQIKGTDIKLYLRWEHMSTIGAYYGDMIEVGAFTGPSKYSGDSKRKYIPGPTSREMNY